MYKLHLFPKRKIVVYSHSQYTTALYDRRGDQAKQKAATMLHEPYVQRS